MSDAGIRGFCDLLPWLPAWLSFTKIDKEEKENSPL